MTSTSILKDPDARSSAPNCGSASSISVVIPFYKELDLIERAIRSVTSQKLPADVRVEVIIGNDSPYSEDQIRAVLSDSSNRITTIVKNHRAKGAGNARNAALEVARGELIAFLDADDYWLPRKLEQQLRLIQAGANFVSGGFQFEGHPKVVLPPQRIRSTAELFKKLRINASTVLVRRDFLGNERFKNLQFSQDTELWARLAGKAGFKFAATPEIVAIYPPSSRTANKFHQFLAFMTVVEEFPLSALERAEIYLRYSVRGVLNYYLRR